MLPIQKKITTVNRYKGGNSKKYIVIHDVGALGQAKANIDYFYNVSRGASAHYFVDKTSIWQSVADNDRSWSVGDDKKNDSHDVGDLINNHNNISIEMCLNPDWKVDPKTKQHTIDLVKYLQKKHDIPNSHVVRHYDASGKKCPGSMSGNNWAEWKAFYKAITGSSSFTSPVKVNAPNTHVVTKGDTLWGLSKQYNVTIQQITDLNNLKSDTIFVGQKLIFNASKNKPTNNPAPIVSSGKPKANLKVDGYLGREVVKALQRYFSTPVDGILSKQSRNSVTINVEASAIDFSNRNGSMVIRELQKLLGVAQDGLFGPSTLKALQKRVGTIQDGKLSRPSLVVMELQRRLNKGQM